MLYSTGKLGSERLCSAKPAEPTWWKKQNPRFPARAQRSLFQRRVGTSWEKGAVWGPNCKGSRWVSRQSECCNRNKQFGAGGTKTANCTSQSGGWRHTLWPLCCMSYLDIRKKVKSHQYCRWTLMVRMQKLSCREECQQRTERTGTGIQFFFFWPCPQHVEVPRPEVEPTPQEWLERQQWPQPGP